MRRDIGFLIAGLAASGCGDKAPKVCDAQLCGAFQTYEEAEGDDPAELATDRHRTPIDYQSRIRVVPNRKKLQALSAPSAPVLSPRSPAVEARVSAVTDLVARAQAYVESARQANAEVESLRKRPLTSQAVKNAKARIQKQGAEGQKLNEFLQKVALARVHSEGMSGEDAEVQAALLVDPVYLDGQGKATSLNVQAFADFLEKEKTFVDAELAKDEAAARRAGTARLRIRAFIKTPGAEFAAVHVTNYDDIEDPRPPKRPRIAFRMTPAERERIERGFKLASDAAEVLRGLRTSGAEVRADLDALGMTLKADLEKIAELPSVFVSSDFKTKLRIVVDKIKEVSPTEYEQLQKGLAQLEKHVATFDAIKKAIEDLKAALKGGDGVGIALVILATAPTVTNAARELTELPGEVRSLLTTTKTLVDSLSKDAVKKAIVKNIAPLVAPTTKALDDFVQKYGSVFELAKKVLAIAKESGSMEVAPLPTSIDSRVRAVGLDNAGAGTIQLSDTPADRDSEVVVKAELVTGPPEDETLIDQTELTYRVDRFGVTSDFNAGLIFVKRVGNGEPEDPAVNFAPAPSLSWILRYRSRTEEWWNILGLGLGAGAAGLQFTEGAPQLGVGPEVSLFSGVAYGGMGWNLQVDDDRRYFYLGIGILETARHFGSAL